MLHGKARIPGSLKHTNDEQTDVGLQEKAREHVDRHPGLRYLADVLRALHDAAAPLRNAKAFYEAFAPRAVMDSFAQRPDLRVKAVKAITGSPATLLRRLPAEALASQIDLLAIEDLPDAERTVRAEADRALGVHELYLKYVDPIDVATYMPAHAIWSYESHDAWWKAEPTAATRGVLAAELKSIRRHAILTDSEILDVLGEESLERHLSLAIRAGLRRAARRAASEGRLFTDTDLFASVDAGGGRDLIDEMVESIPLPQLRDVIVHACRAMGLSALDDSEEPTKVSSGNAAKDAAAIPIPVGQRVGPKPTPAVTAASMPAPGAGKLRMPNDRAATPPPKPIPPVPPPKLGRAAPSPSELDAPPQPDDEFAFLEEVSGRVV